MKDEVLPIWKYLEMHEILKTNIGWGGAILNAFS